MKSILLKTLPSLIGVAFLSAVIHAQSVYPTGTTIWTTGATNDGYTVFAPAGFVVMIDMDGTEVNRWVAPTAGDTISTVDPLDNGHILVYERPPGPRVTYTATELDYDGNVVWTYTLPAWLPPSTVFHHDSERLANGNTMFLMREEVALPQYNTEPFEDDAILEVDPAGNVVWIWRLREHIADLNLTPLQLGLIRDQAGDWAHANSIDVIGPNNHADPAFAEGNVVISLRFLNTIAIIDKVSGAIVWRDGPDEDHLTWGAHWPYMIEQGLPGQGNILVFSNGRGVGYADLSRSPGVSQVFEIDPVTKTVVWEYEDPTDSNWFYSAGQSGAQRLANGNTLICATAKGRLFEVQPDGTNVWEYMSPYADSRGRLRVFRAYRVPYSWKP